MNRQLEARPYTAWQLLKTFWQSEQRVSAYALSIVVIVFSLLIIGVEVALTNWFNYFYNALQDYDKKSVWDLIFVFMFLAALFIIFQVYRYYSQQFLAWRWRRWLTEQFLNRWLEKKSYYYLENFDDQTDNPDQRIQEDIISLVTLSLNLVIGMLSAIVTFFAFIFILWELSGILTIPLGKWGSLQVPGYLVWASIIYSIIGTFLTFKIGRPLVTLNFEQQRREANFRFAAIDLRSHAENVALYRGEHHQKNILQKIFGSVLENWYAIILRQKLLLWFTAGYNQVSVLVPLMVVLPNYFNKVFRLGGLRQSLAAFQHIQDALSFLVNAYPTIAEWRAVMRRLLTFLNHIHQVEQDAVIKNKFYPVENSQNKIVTKNLTVNTPQGTPLLQKINEELTHGQHYLIKGASGIGKSTFVRVLAGIWPYGSGEISLPQKRSIMFLPQRTYMPLGTLQEALLFPDKVTSVSEEVLVKLLQECDLPNLTNQLQYETRWSEHLSPGEMQRVAFVRVLLHKPDWVFLDESTSSLDLAHEKHLYELLKKQLPSCSLISIGHRPSLEAYHDKMIDLEKYQVSHM